MGRCCQLQHERHLDWDSGIQNRPKYVPDIYMYYQEYKPIQQTGRTYSKQMFGANFSESFTFEAIGLPLKMVRREKGWDIDLIPPELSRAMLSDF